MRISKLLIAVIILSVIGTVLLYPSLPQVIPQHWNMDGQPDRFGAKSFTFFTALLPLVTYILMWFFPKIDSKRESYQIHQQAYQVTAIAVVGFLIVIHWITLLVAKGIPLNVGVITRVLIGLLFILLGNYLGQIRHNYFFGIRTPWTLANETVWRKTNRLGGYGFIIVGFCALLSGFLPGKIAFVLFLGSLVAVIPAIFIYSYCEYRKLNLPK